MVDQLIRLVEQMMHNGNQNYEVNYSNNYETEWKYLQAKRYDNWQAIFQVFPHLKNINNHLDLQNQTKANGITIRSANDDNVHKAIKYGIWTTTPKNRNRIEQLWQRKVNNNVNTYLFFSAVKSGMFEGVARLKSIYHEETFPFWWENHTLKFKGYFQIEWVYIKDINYKHFQGLYNNEGEEVIKSKDCDIINSETTLKMLKIYDQRPFKRHIFMDFAYMDDRESQYIRKIYEMNNYYNNKYQLNYQPQPNYNMNWLDNPINYLNNINPTNPINPMMQLPTSLMRPANRDLQQVNSLGFQMNPVSKNKKN